MFVWSFFLKKTMIISIFLDYCASSPCRNGGTCYQGPFTFSCKCPSPYKGTQCESGTTNFCKLNISNRTFSLILFIL